MFFIFQTAFVLESPLPASITGMRNESIRSVCECAMWLSGSFGELQNFMKFSGTDMLSSQVSMSESFQYKYNVHINRTH